jgi:predicted dehydrogenase
MEPPSQFVLAPRGTLDGPARNVAQAYARLAAALRGDTAYQPDFAHAVKPHKLIEAMERSGAEGRAVQFS